MELRPYQEEFLAAVDADFQQFNRLLGVGATGCGKTILAAEHIRRTSGRCLFLADAIELVRQNADKYFRHTGEVAGVEMADQQASPGDRVVIATTQSIVGRLNKYRPDHFSRLIVDEAHRNTLGAYAEKVLSYFSSAKVLGLTATPFRSDRKQLGSFYEKISIEVGLQRLISEGYLSPIVIKAVPLQVSLDKVRSVAGEYSANDLHGELVPHLLEAAKLIAGHAVHRKTVVFLPLIETSKAFVEACRSIGLRAVHVDGTDRTGVEQFTAGRFDIIACSSLLTTGWDCPQVDCVFPLRPTKSLSLFQQMVGRGTRLSPGKENLLLLDPLFLTEDHSLVKSARLIAKTEAEAEDLQELLESGEEIDLFEAEEQAVEKRASRLEAELKAKARKSSRTIDAMEFFLNMEEIALADYRPEFRWESEPLTDKQKEILSKSGIALESIKGKGHASKLLDLIFRRRELKLASPKQVALLKKWGVEKPHQVSFAKAGAIIGEKIGGRKN
jgi:superfamily II DNA or RNA helicase